MSEEQVTKLSRKIYIDQVEFIINQKVITAAKIRELANAPNHFGVWVKPERKPRQQLKEADEISLSEAGSTSFFTGSQLSIS